MRKRLPIANRFWSKVSRSDGCWIWVGAVANHGYGTLKRQTGKMVAAHRLSWEIHFGPIRKGLIVCHKCDNPKCVNPGHLFLGTHKDNVADMIKKGRFKQSNYDRSKRSNPKFSLIDVLLIRILSKYITMYRLSKDLNVDWSTIRDIVKQNTYKHLS